MSSYIESPSGAVLQLEQSVGEFAMAVTIHEFNGRAVQNTWTKHGQGEWTRAILEEVTGKGGDHLTRAFTEVLRCRQLAPTNINKIAMIGIMAQINRLRGKAA